MDQQGQSWSVSKLRLKVCVVKDQFGLIPHHQVMGNQEAKNEIELLSQSMVLYLGEKRKPNCLRGG